MNFGLHEVDLDFIYFFRLVCFFSITIKMLSLLSNIYYGEEKRKGKI